MKIRHNRRVAESAEKKNIFKIFINLSLCPLVRQEAYHFQLVTYLCGTQVGNPTQLICHSAGRDEDSIDGDIYTEAP